MWMKNDLFNGKIKRQYIGYIWFSIILGTAIFMGTGALLLFTVLQRDPGSADWNVLLGIGIFFCLIGFVFFYIVFKFIFPSLITKILMFVFHYDSSVHKIINFVS